MKSVTPKYHGFALTSITSSFVLFACIEGSTDLHFALWDIRFSIVLATQRFNLPPSLTTGPKTDFQVKVTVVTQTEIVVLVSPSTKFDTLSSSRSAIFVFPVTIPKSSSIALAMGKVTDAPVWLRTTNAPSIREEGAQQEVLNRIQEAINNETPHNADNIFFTWVEKECAKTGVQEDTKVGRTNNIDKPSWRPTHKASKVSVSLSKRVLAIMLNLFVFSSPDYQS